MKRFRQLVVFIILVLTLSACENNNQQSVDITFKANGGAYESAFLETVTPEHTMVIQNFNIEESDALTLYTSGQTKLRWVNKLFLKYDETLDLYQVSYKDAMTASVSDLGVTDYDFIIGMHNQNNDVVYKTMFQTLLNTESSIYIRFNQDPNDYTTGDLKAYIYTQTYFETIHKSYEDDVQLPTLTKDGYTFLGWTYEDELLTEININKVLKPITLEATWRGKSVTQLEYYLESVIPTETNESIYLPLTYSGYQLEWSSSEPSIIDHTGKYTKPYQATDVILTVNVTGLETLTLTFAINVTGYKSLEGPIASSYIYRNYDKVNDRFFEILDVINTAFIIADDTGALNGSSYLNNVSTYIMPKAKIHGNYVIMSVAPESSWSTIAGNVSLRESFANNIVSMINEYGFDGVDIDWETPLDSEKTRYTQLMKVVYEKVKANNPNHLVTTAITGGMWQPPRYDLNNSKVYLDYINLMTYGMTNGGGQYQNPLYRSTTYDYPSYVAGRTLGTASIDETVKDFKAAYGIEYSKIIVGLAFYGIRQMRTYNSDTQTFSSWGNGSSVYYNDIVSNYLPNDAYIKRYDTNAGVPYIIKADGTEFISYDNPRSILEKTAYVKTLGLGGVMFWEYGTDTTNTLLEAIDQGFQP